MDRPRPRFFGRVFNPYWKYDLNRKLCFFIAVGLGLIPWILFGFDSCIGQPLMLLARMPEHLTGTLSYADWWHQTWVNHYGKEMHYSAFLIYGLAYVALSHHFKNLGITHSKNMIFSFIIMLFSVGVFEFYWIGSYSYFQNQPWVSRLQFPQLRILIQNFVFVTIGIFGIFYIWANGYFHPIDTKRQMEKPWYRFRWNKLSYLLVGLCLFFGVLWWFYPWSVEHIRVEYETGEVWTNSRMFPQTLYTIDVNPHDSVNAGVWFFVENNAIHAMNTLVKILWTFTIVYVGLVKRT